MTSIRAQPGTQVFISWSVCPLFPVSLNTPMLSLRTLATVASIIGAIVSLWLMLSLHSSAPLFLVILFVGWVVSPFAALVATHLLSSRWSPSTRRALQVATMIVVIGSVALYADVAFRPPASQPAARWLIVPAVSWLVIAILPFIIKLLSRTRSAR